MAGKLPGWIVAGYPPLKYDDVGKAAINSQICPADVEQPAACAVGTRREEVVGSGSDGQEYPTVVRNTLDPVLPKQQFGLLSFMFLSEPKKIPDTESTIIGFVKLRGNYPDVGSCTAQAEKLVRKVDSKFTIRVAQVGKWVPITSHIFKGEQVISLQERSETEEIAHREVQRAKESVERDLEKRRRDLEDSQKIPYDPESLDSYTEKRTAEENVSKLIEQERNRLKGYILAARKIHGTLAELEEKHPEYASQWIDNCNKERVKVSLPALEETSEDRAKYFVRRKEYTESLV